MSTHGNVDHKTQCPECAESGRDNSHDNLAVYEDGYSTCYACDYFHYDKGAKEVPKEKKPKKVTPMIDLNIKDLGRRKVSKEVCEHYGYGSSTLHGSPCQVANYKDSSGKTVAQKIRFKDKKFFWTGDKSQVQGFFGQSMYQKGKKLVITEGEVDALSVSQVIGKNWPVVSLPDGAGSAEKVCKEQLEYLSGFEEIVLFFDADEPGIEAAAQVSKLLPGRCKTAQYPEGFKDASDLLQAGRGEDIKQAYWNAVETYVDGDIVELGSLDYEDIMSEPVIGYDTPFTDLNEAIKGLRKGELTIVTAGSGIGKSTIVREIGYKLALKYGLKVGNIYLEEGVAKTAQGYIALHNNIPLGLLRMNPSLLSKEVFLDTRKEVFEKTGMLSLNHFGSLECDKLISKLEYLSVGQSVDFIILDHISMVVSGLATDNERKDIDRLMTALRSFIERTGVGVIGVVHLKRPSTGDSFNKGREVSLTDLRGSASLEQLSDNVVAAERDQQDEEKKHIIQLRVLKCREFGDATGLAGACMYKVDTGRLVNTVVPTTQSSMPPINSNKNSNNNEDF